MSADKDSGLHSGTLNPTIPYLWSREVLNGDVGQFCGKYGDEIVNMRQSIAVVASLQISPRTSCSDTLFHSVHSRLFVDMIYECLWWISVYSLTNTASVLQHCYFGIRKSISPF